MVKEFSGIIKNLNLDEKAFLLSGKSFWEIRGINENELKTIIVSDGPHGLRRAVDISEGGGNSKSIKAICFPTASAQSCSFDEDLLFKLGQLLGDESQAENVQVLLGPANNIKRTPLCGRNFEYYSEDPYLAGKLSTALIKGIQSKGIGTSLKHFIANNQEKFRMSIDAIIDERTLREIYLTAFEEPVKEGKPWTIMGSYNRMNGVYACQNTYLLENILRKEWNYTGVIMSDWGAVDQLHESIQASLDVEMPTSGDIGPKKIIKAVKKGTLSLEAVNNSSTRVLELVDKANESIAHIESYNKDEHHQKAREIGRECIVLLKNENNILPLSNEKYQSIALIGDFAVHPRFQGGGSSHINPYKIDSLVEEFKSNSHGFTVQFAKGYDRNSDDIDTELVNEALSLAKTSDVALVLIGLPDRYETEGVDRSHLNMPPNQIKLVEEVVKVNANTVVVLSIGSGVKIPFKDSIKGLVCAWLLGEAGAGAIYDVLTGISNPSGRLAETFIKQEQDDPSFGNYPGDKEVEYKEGVFIGYRFHDYNNKEVEFEFGFGLSYTDFIYSNLHVSKDTIKDTETVTVSVDIKNTGSVGGKEVVQLYISEVNSLVKRPPKELKGFKKIFLQPGEQKNVEFILNKRSFAYYNVDINDWHVKSGKFIIMIGKSSRNIVLQKEIIVKSSNESITSVTQDMVYVKRIKLKKTRKITRNTIMEELKGHPIGISIYKRMEKEFKKQMKSDAENEDNVVMDENTTNEFLNNLPLRSLVNLTKGEGLSERRMNLLIFLLNRTRKDTIMGKIISIFKKP